MSFLNEACSALWSALSHLELQYLFTPSGGGGDIQYKKDMGGHHTFHGLKVVLVPLMVHSLKKSTVRAFVESIQCNHLDCY